jgi:transposase
MSWLYDRREQMRHLYVDEGLTCAEVAKIVGKGHSTVQRRLAKLGVIRKKARD